MAGVTAFYFLVQQPAVQTWMTRQATSILSDQLDAKVSIESVNIKFFRRVELENIYIEDQQQDTLLYAYRAQVKIGLFRPVKKTVNISHIELENVYVNLYRTDSMAAFNYQFIADKLSGDEEKDTTAAPWSLGLGTANLCNLRFNYLDEPGRNSYKAAMGGLEVDMDALDLVNNHVSLHSVSVYSADFAIKKLLKNTAEVKEDTTSSVAEVPDTTGAGEGKPLTASVGRVMITNSHFSLDDANKTPQPKGMDYNHLGVNNIHLDASDLQFRNDTIAVNIENLVAEEKSGFKLNHLHASAIIAPTLVECSNMLIRTPSSAIGHYYAMHFDSFDAFGNFEQAVEMQGEFSNARVSMGDVNFFAHALSAIEHNTLDLSGTIKGTVDNLKGRGLTIKTGRHTVFKGDAELNGLPEFDDTFMEFEVDELLTSSRDFKRFYPKAKIPESLHKVGVSTFSGNFIGFANDFVANGTLQTAIGTISTDMNMNIEQGSGTAHYQGKLDVQDFDIGAFANTDFLGKATFNATVQGQGLSLETLDVDADGTIDSIFINNYNYRNVELNGHISQRLFNGYLAIEDKNIQFDFDGQINMVDNQNGKASFAANIDHADLQALNFTKDSFRLSSNVNMDINGIDLDSLSNPDRLLGNVAITKTSIHTQDTIFKLDTLKVSASRPAANEKQLSISSDVLAANFKGDFNFRYLPDALAGLFIHYFGTPEENDVIARVKKQPVQSFQFDIEMKNTGHLTQLFLPQLKNIEKGSVNGLYTSRDQFFGLNAYFPSITYSDARLKYISISGLTVDDHITLDATVDTVFYKDSLLTETVALNTEVRKDSVNFRFNVQDDASPSKIRMGGLLTTNLKSVTLRLLNSSFTVEGQQWQFNDKNRIYYDPDELQVDELVIAKDDQSIVLQSFASHGKKNNLGVELKNLSLNDLTASLSLLSGYQVGGLANGNISVMNVLEEPKMVASVKVDTLSVNHYRLGNLNLESNYNNANDLVRVDAGLSGQVNKLRVTGKYYLSKANDNIDFKGRIDQLNLVSLEPFTGDAISKTSGMADGQFRLTGSFRSPLVNGNLNIDSLSTRVNYLNSFFHLPDAQLVFNGQELTVDPVALFDDEGNEAILEARVQYPNINRPDIYCEIYIPDNKRFRLLNTTAASGESFYGKAYANGLILFTGTPGDMELFAQVTTQKNTEVSIDVAQTQDVTDYTFYRFVGDDKEKGTAQYQTQLSGLTIDLEASVTQDAQINLILSYEEGDVIEVVGDGDLKIGIDQAGEMSMYGNLEIVDGNYLFTLQNIISKKFNMEKGSTIVWTGDPEDAQLDINAVYKLRAAPYDLVEDMVSENVQAAKNRVPVYLYLVITGALSDPDISFDIKIPDADPSIRTIVNSKLNQLKVDQNELNKQVVGLLILNRFLPPYPVGSAEGSNFAEGVNNTVSEFVSNQLSNYLSDWLSEFVTEIQLDINYRTYENQVNGGSGDVSLQQHQELQLALSKSFFNDRITIDVGGNFDFGQGSSEGESAGNNIAGDFEFKYSITPDGRIKAKVFRKGQYDVFTERNINKTGLGISFTREFNSFSDIIDDLKEKRERRKKKKQKKKDKKKNNASGKEEEEPAAQPDGDETDEEEQPSSDSTPGTN